MNSLVFSEIVKFDKLHQKRINISKTLVSGLDKYLWARKPTEGLPPQLRALHQYELSLANNNADPFAEYDVASISKNVPSSVQQLFSKHLQNVAGGNQKQKKIDKKTIEEKTMEEKMEEKRARAKRKVLVSRLPAWHEDEGGQWGATILGTKKKEKKDKKVAFMLCMSSGTFVENGQMVEVFQCGHVISSGKSTYGMCPICPL